MRGEKEKGIKREGKEKEIKREGGREGQVRGEKESGSQVFIVFVS